MIQGNTTDVYTQEEEKGMGWYRTFRDFLSAQRTNLMKHRTQHGGDMFDVTGFMEFARQTYKDFI